MSNARAAIFQRLNAVERPTVDVSQRESLSLFAWDKAERIREAVRATIESGARVTRDLGGTASTSEFTQAIIDRL